MKEVKGGVCPVSSDEHDSAGAVHRCIHAAVHILEPEAKEKSLPVLALCSGIASYTHSPCSLTVDT